MSTTEYSFAMTSAIVNFTANFSDSWIDLDGMLLLQFLRPWALKQGRWWIDPPRLYQALMYVRASFGIAAFFTCSVKGGWFYGIFHPETTVWE